MRQIPAPLPLDIAPLAEPIPSTPEAQSPRPGKRIFSGCDSTFHLDGNNGTGAYWVGGKHYLAKLTWLRTDQNFVYFTGSGEGGVQAWAFLDIESCGRSRVYARMTSGGWRLFDCDFRELPN
jgi:hypothetical protein